MRIRLAAFVSALALVAIACGQKPGVHARGVGLIPGQMTGQSGTGNAGVPVPEASPSFDPTTGQFVDPTTGQVVDPTTGQPAGTGTTGTIPGGGGSGPSVSGASGGDRTGVTPTKITIGLHAPVTGAAPVRSDSFETGRDLYWKKGNNGGPIKVHGREVEVVFENDNYNPSTARGKCKSMAETKKAFLLIGGAGTDQIYSCASYARDRGIPYLSAGVVQNHLSKFPNYFALSMTYAQQGKLLSDFIKANASDFGCSGPCRVGAVITNTGNFDDALAAFKNAYGNVTVIRPSKNDSGAEYGSQLCTGPSKNFDVVYPLTSPTFWLEMASSPTASCNPQYVGVGISMGLDTVASTGCKSAPAAINGSFFFSPVPSYTSDATKDPAFVKAGGTDDIHWLLWGLMKTVHQMLLKAGKDLTRKGFINAVQGSSISTGVFPPLKYSPSNHFGATKVSVLEANCVGSGGHYTTRSKSAPPF